MRNVHRHDVRYASVLPSSAKRLHARINAAIYRVVTPRARVARPSLFAGVPAGLRTEGGRWGRPWGKLSRRGKRDGKTSLGNPAALYK
jgi:hypothetical protein